MTSEEAIALVEALSYEENLLLNALLLQIVANDADNKGGEQKRSH